MLKLGRSVRWLDRQAAAPWAGPSVTQDDVTASSHDGGSQGFRGRLILAIALALLVVIAVFGVLTYRALSEARSDLNEAKSLISKDLNAGSSLLSEKGRRSTERDLVRVAADTTAAEQAVRSSFAVSILGALPFLHAQRNGVMSLAEDAGSSAGVGRSLILRIDDLEKASAGTTVSLDQLARLGTAVRRARVRLRGFDRSAAGLWGSLGTARTTFDRDDRRIVSILTQGSRAISFALPFLGADGPRQYAIAGENNSEMRDQGAVESVALMRAQAGTLSVVSASSVDNLTPLKAPVGVTIPTGTNAIFGGLQTTQIWTSVNATADFSFSGSVMKDMFPLTTAQQVDGVIGLDVPTLASLLKLTGPVAVPGIVQPITASNVANVLLNQLYGGISPGGQNQRHDEISGAAQAIFHALSGEHVDIAALAHALADDIQGRHLMVWDANATSESTLKALGASGDIDTSHPDRTFHLAVENATATKLDYFVNVGLTTHVKIDAVGDALVDTSVKIRNTAPAGQPASFQLGPDDINSFTTGQYVSRVEFWSPAGSIVAEGTPESGLVLRQVETSVLPQQTGTVTFQTVIPHAVVNGHLELRFVPQPRLVPEQLSIDLSAPGWGIQGPAHRSQSLGTTATFTWGLLRHASG